MKSSKHTKDLIAKGLLKIKVSRKEPPTHAWDWKQFNCLLHEELDYLTPRLAGKSLINLTPNLLLLMMNFQG